ncbi:hypothetical protein [Aquamicrobium zhengzhouense]|uniref:Uncharacterized protein n=1 Tax=Aquamicrobium zhengzhouense TaxID=2781738 RepID=A0ABS0SAS2_9HYPH|nr:hypothetical protein [Aquamicrobium zhengzhouense]MBI1620361.1 hypothetical protein [Aquamicrobium zhengzhouense]
MTLYSLNGSYPAPLPFRIILSSGATRTDPATFTPAEIADAGYVEAPAKPAFDPATHQLGWDSENWTVTELPPLEPVYEPLTARQLRLGLIGAGVSLADVDAAIDGIPDEAGREVARVEWEYASQFEREHPLIGQVGSALGMSAEDINTAWLAAADL